MHSYALAAIEHLLYFANETVFAIEFTSALHWEPFGTKQNSYCLFLFRTNLMHMQLHLNFHWQNTTFKNISNFQINFNWFQRVHFLLLKVEIPLLFDAIYSCPGLALLCQVRFYFFLKGIPWSDSGVRFVTLPLFNCLCTLRRCEDRRLLSRHNIDTVR